MAGADFLQLVPLGGLGEIGRNCLVLEQRDERVMIDCGVSFPFGDDGSQVIHPRFDHVLARPDAFRGVVLTHGHEDHIGAVPHLLRALHQAGRERLDIWGPRHALGLVRRRLDEAQLLDAADLHAVAPGERFEVGTFRFEPVRVTHSIPDATALAIETDAGTVVHTGDFKLDDGPSDGELSDEARFSALGDEGVALLLSDSTNVLSEGHSGSERTVAEALARAVAEAPARVIIGVFASNVHRLVAIGAACIAAGRKLCLLGRSVQNHVELGSELGMLRWPSDLRVSPERAASLPRGEICYIAGGTQGEERGALRRLASGMHQGLRLEPGDVVILSSRVIPGNERGVNGMVDALLALGVDVRTRHAEPELHVSGHGHRDEQRRMLALTRPRAFVPVHGTRIHMLRHEALARELGVAHTLLMQDGDVARLDADGLTKVGEARTGIVALAGTPSQPVALDDEVLRERRQLGRAGIAFVALDGDRVVVRVRGLPTADALVVEGERAARSALRALGAERGPQAQEMVRRAVRRRLTELLGDKPPVEVVAFD